MCRKSREELTMKKANIDARQIIHYCSFAGLFTAFLFASLQCGKGDPRQELRDHRAKLRSYTGAPPVAPHSTTEKAYANNCLGCHKRGFIIKEETDSGIEKRVVGPITPHPEWVNCVQCHLSKNDSSRFVGNNFTPYRLSYMKKVIPEGESSDDMGPPTMPHPLQYREDCKVCHTSRTSAKALQPPHGEMDGCIYCHQEDPSVAVYKE